MLNGTTIIIEFEMDGEDHKTIQWSTGKELLGKSYAATVMKHYEALGATSIRISKVERTQIAML